MTIQQAKIGWRIAIILVCFLALAITGCPKPDSAGADVSPSVQQPGSTKPAEKKQSEAASAVVSSTLDVEVDRATFVFTSDFQGFQRPCGCAVAQHGGLLRLASITQTVGDALGSGDASTLSDFSVSLPVGMSGEHSLWLVDCGNYADDSRRFPGLRVETHLAALAQAGAGRGVAAVVNQNELLLSEEEATIGFAASPVPLACCNVSVNIPGLNFEKSVQLAKNWYLIGLAANTPHTPGAGQGGWWEYHDPVQSVVQVLSELPDGANVVVAAAHQPNEVIAELQKLAVRAVIGGEGLRKYETTEGFAPRFNTPGSRGRKLQLLSFDDGFTNGFEPWFIVAGEEWPDVPAVWETLTAFQTEFSQLVAEEMATLYGVGGFDNITWGMDNKYLPPSEKPKIIFEGLHYVGAKQCQECHTSEYDALQQSIHASAWNSLVEAGEQATLDCLQCHTTGMLEPGGYLPFAHDDDVVSVGCESCHGPGSEHLEWVAAGAGEFDGSTEAKITRGSLEDCLVCHDEYNSPDFEAGEYWDAIAH